MPLSPSARLRFTIDLASTRLNALGREFWMHPDIGRLVPGYFAILHSSMRTTVPMLQAAAARARELASDDPVAAMLAPYLERHAREELHHDDWLLEDMVLLGMDADAVARAPGGPEVAEMIGAQYYWITFGHPVAVLGCLAVLEGTPPDERLIDAVVARSGLPREAFRTIYKHAVLDPHHRDDLDELIDTLPLAPEHAALMGTSAIQVANRLTSVAERILGASSVAVAA